MLLRSWDRSTDTTRVPRWSSGWSRCCTRHRQQGVELVVYPELALTTFFPRWFVDDITEADHWYERSMPNADTQPLFDEAKRLGIGFCLGYALLETASDGSTHRWNVQTLVERDGSIVATYKKTHIPGHEHHEPDRPFQHAERYYFEPSPDGFGVWRAFGGLIGHDDLQRPPLARDVPRDGAAGRRDDPVRLQHAHPLRPRPQPGHPAGVPQRARDAVGRVPERHVGGRRGQGWRRGGRRLARRSR